LLRNFPQDKKVLNNEPEKFFNLFKVYEDNDEKLQEIIDGCPSFYKMKNFRSYYLRFMVNSKLSKDDIEGAISLFDKIASSKKYLASRDELLSRLVVDENLEALQRVIDICIRVTGEETTLYSLSKVFLKEGRRQQAKKMLETPGLRYNQRQMDGIMKFFINSGRNDCVKDLVQFSRNIFGCDRDHMFYTWVDAVKKDASEVEDIWMEIQEEGHMPSKELRMLIAKVLKAANKDIPFDTTDLEVDNKAKNKEIKSDAKEETRSDTISADELDGLLKELKMDNVTDNQLRDGFKRLEKSKKFDEAAQLLKDLGYPHQKLGLGICQIFARNMVEQCTAEKAIQFLTDLPTEVEAAFKKDTNLFKLHMKKSDTETILNSIKCMELGKHRGTYCQSNKIMSDRINKDSSFLAKIEDLSNDGYGAATVMLARYACHQQNSQQFARCWSLDTREDRKHVAKEMVVDIKNLESLKWISEAVNNDLQVLTEATNMCLAYDNQKRDKEIIDFALTNGLSFEVINTTALKRVSSLPEFNQNMDEIKRILDSRK